MKRILEPELMENEEQTLAYSNADFAFSNHSFIDYIIENSKIKTGNILDLGCGPGDLDIELTKKLPDVQIFAIDGSAQMVDLATQKIAKHNLTDRVEILQDILPNLNLPEGKFDLIISKDLLHHIPSPNDFWAEINRLANNHTQIYVMDLIRPDSIDKAKKIVESISASEPEVLQEDFYNSLLAAFTFDEVKEQMERANLNYQIDNLGDRHFIAKCKKMN
ncbi:MAG: class I SAM-dependent methyltransferase [Bacteroidetes bacterium]|jgi:ubiquinone/menaquinone biosynthesis C-methylase UbiE|nr:class I SAM-dependent methyltransferase [Bacteroidota bacterium]MBT6684900.1 class I SAM-dependent methyltransferase [Bacteroidota bacterium]MBT7143323.1 class I SAM-dependent methyltransferase [Bacteroidota bacterium]MBT7493421.1 class I SAM-dependent methyltransferase [Bacteroidota bacterium]